MRAIRVNLKNGASKTVVIPSGASAESEHVIRSLVIKAINERQLRLEDIDLEGPRYVKITVLLPRPKAHYRTGKHSEEIKNTAPVYPCSKPDVDKLARTVLDALTGIIWRDDAQVVSLEIRKFYDRYAHATIEAGPLIDDNPIR